MPITTLSIIGGIIVAFIGGIFSGGGVVEALKARRAAKAVDEKVSVEKFEATIRGGSSPLARGALQGPYSSSRPLGIIPACAGSTNPPVRGFGNNRDHPRLRGEHAVQILSSNTSAGSSPLARGAP